MGKAAIMADRESWEVALGAAVLDNRCLAPIADI
jgi:hypothetical protein